MPRSPRVALPGTAIHVVQRGVNRAALFIDDDDGRARYLALLRNEAERANIVIHATC